MKNVFIIFVFIIYVVVVVVDSMDHAKSDGPILFKFVQNLYDYVWPE